MPVEICLPGNHVEPVNDLIARLRAEFALLEVDALRGQRLLKEKSEEFAKANAHKVLTDRLQALVPEAVLVVIGDSSDLSQQRQSLLLVREHAIWIGDDIPQLQTRCSRVLGFSPGIFLQPADMIRYKGSSAFTRTTVVILWKLMFAVAGSLVACFIFPPLMAGPPSLLGVWMRDFGNGYHAAIASVTVIVAFSLLYTLTPPFQSALVVWLGASSSRRLRTLFSVPLVLLVAVPASLGAVSGAFEQPFDTHYWWMVANSACCCLLLTPFYLLGMRDITFETILADLTPRAETSRPSKLQKRLENCLLLVLAGSIGIALFDEGFAGLLGVVFLSILIGFLSAATMRLAKLSLAVMRHQRSVFLSPVLTVAVVAAWGVFLVICHDIFRFLPGMTADAISGTANYTSRYCVSRSIGRGASSRFEPSDRVVLKAANSRPLRWILPDDIVATNQFALDMFDLVDGKSPSRFPSRGDRGLEIEAFAKVLLLDNPVSEEIRASLISKAADGLRIAAKVKQSYYFEKMVTVRLYHFLADKRAKATK